MLKDPKLQFERSNIHQSGKYSENLVKFTPKQTVNSIEISLKKQTFQNFVKQKLNKMQKSAKKFFLGIIKGELYVMQPVVLNQISTLFSIKTLSHNSPQHLHLLYKCCE